MGGRTTCATKEFGESRNSEPGRLGRILSKKYETLNEEGRVSKQVFHHQSQGFETAVADNLRTAWLQPARELRLVFLFLLIGSVTCIRPSSVLISEAGKISRESISDVQGHGHWQGESPCGSSGHRGPRRNLLAPWWGTAKVEEKHESKCLWENTAQHL